MKKYIISLLIIIFLISSFIFFNKSQTAKTTTPIPSPISQQSPIPTPTNITASFTIITDSITRSFKAEKYHNQSQDVYIENPEPSIIFVKKAGITWDDFFKTLPMKLTKDCLTTGDGENLCNDKNGSLKFFLNDIETPNLLDKSIKQDDKIIIKYTSTRS